MDTDALIEPIRLALAAENPKPVCAYLFGSHGRGEARGESDVDVAVLYADTPPATLSGSGFRLQAGLEGLLGVSVDLIVLNRASPELVHNVLRDGILLFDDDPSVRVAFEVKARREYHDVRRYLREYRGLTIDRAS